MSTNRRELVHQLQATLSKMEVALGAIADAVVFLDEDSQVEWCNNAFEQLVKRSHSTLVGSKFSELLPLMQAGQPVAPDAYPDVKLREGEYEATEYELVQSDRTLILEISGNCIQQSDRPLGGAKGNRSAVLVIRDITPTQPKEAEPRTAEQEQGKQVEEKLRQNEAFLAIVQSVGHVGSWQFDVDTGNITWSEEVFHIHGFDPNKPEPTYAELIEQVHPDDRAFWQERVSHAIATGTPYQMDFRFIRPDGSIRYLEGRGKAVFDEQRRVCQLLGAVADITERKQAEEALKASEARLNAILSSALAAIKRLRCYANCEWECEYVSAGSTQLWGYSPEELIANKNAYLLRIVPEDLEAIKQTAFDDIFAERTYEGEYRYNHPDGSLRWMSFSLTSVRNDASDCWIVTTISTDITDKKRAEIALAESEFKFRTIVENANDVIAILNLDGIIRYVSPNLLNIMGYTPAELEGQSFESIVYPDDAAEIWKAFQELSTTQESVSGLEHRTRHQDGSWIWLSSNLSTLQDTGGDLLVVSVARDITERKQASDALKASEARLNAILSNLVACIQRSRIYANRDWNYEYVSAGSLQLWGYSPQELMADKNLILSRHVPEDLERIYQNVFDQIFVEGTYEGEYRYHHPDGRLRWISFNMNSVRDEATDCWICTGISTDITARKLAEAALAERARLAAFRADVGSALGMSDTLPVILNCCTQAAVQHLNATFARIWTFNPKDDVFELKASAGLYTRLNGTYSRVPITKFFIGRKPQPYITNSLPDDPYIADKDWVKREGLLALACYPIMLEQELLGIIVIFARQKLSESTLEALQFAAKEIALGIKRKQAEAALEYRAKVESLLSSISRHFIDQDVDTAINFTLEAIANFLDVERSYIFELSDDMKQYHLVREWCAVGIPARSDDGRVGNLTMFPWIYEHLLNHQAIAISSLAEFPPEATAERAIFQRQSVQSVLVVPMTHSDKVVGCLGLEVVRCSKTWTQDDISFLKLVGELMGASHFGRYTQTGKIQ